MPLAQVQGFDLECFYYISSQDASTLGSEDASLLYLGSAGICEGTATDKICDAHRNAATGPWVCRWLKSWTRVAKRLGATQSMGNAGSCWLYYMIIIQKYPNSRRKFRSQTSDNKDRWKKQRWEESQKRRAEERRSEKRKSQKKEDAGARKGRKVAIHCVFPMIWGSGGSKSRLAKAAGAEPAGQMRDEKLHAVVARSTFRSQNVQRKPGSEHFWKLRCRKSARRCSAKHISKSKSVKN